MVTRDLVPISKESLTPAEFNALSDIPPELEWLANITNPKTRRAYKNDVGEFSAFTGLRQPVELRTITRAHVIARRKHLESRALAPSSILRKHSAGSVPDTATMLPTLTARQNPICGSNGDPDETEVRFCSIARNP